jgi:hypothetical protein
VLDAHDITVFVEQSRRTIVITRIVLLDLDLNPGWISITSGAIIHRGDEHRSPVVGKTGDGLREIVRERGDPTSSRKIIAYEANGPRSEILVRDLGHRRFLSHGLDPTA